MGWGGHHYFVVLGIESGYLMCAAGAMLLRYNANFDWFFPGPWKKYHREHETLIIETRDVFFPDVERRLGTYKGIVSKLSS